MKRSNTTLPTVTDCEGCGVCCLQMGYPEYIYDSEHGPDEEHWTNLPADLKQELLTFIENYQHPPEGELDGPCIWLDPETRRCKHHAYRPNVCRDFEVGCKDCLGWREHHASLIRPPS